MLAYIFFLPGLNPLTMDMSPNLDTNPEAMKLDTLEGKISFYYMEICPSVLCGDHMASVMILNLIEQIFPSMIDTTLQKVELYEEIANPKICCHDLAFSFTIAYQVLIKRLDWQGQC